MLSVRDLLLRMVYTCVIIYAYYRVKVQRWSKIFFKYMQVSLNFILFLYRLLAYIYAERSDKTITYKGKVGDKRKKPSIFLVQSNYYFVFFLSLSIFFTVVPINVLNYLIIFNKGIIILNSICNLFCSFWWGICISGWFRIGYWWNSHTTSFWSNFRDVGYQGASGHRVLWNKSQL